MTGDVIDVLLVEDNDGDALLTMEALEEAAPKGRLAVERVASLGAAMAALEQRTPTCVLLDLGLPDAGDGIAALRSVLAVQPTVAVVVLTGLDDSASAAAAVAAGAQDYLVKRPLPDGDALLRAIRFAAERGEAMAALRTSNNELAAFAQTIAHDLRGPLATVVGLASLVASDPGMAESVRTDLLGRIVGSAERLSRMVSGLLGYAETAGAGRDAVALRDVVSWVLGLVEADLAAVGGTVEVGELPTVVSNEPALRTVVLNLLSNAVKYRDDDRRLQVRVAAERDVDVVRLVVADNGRGVAPEDVERVFELGERAGDTTSREGAGVGLSAVRRLVQQVGGTVYLEAGDDGLGTRAVVELPDQLVAVVEST